MTDLHSTPEQLAGAASRARRGFPNEDPRVYLNVKHKMEPDLQTTHVSKNNMKKRE
jgi:hypothetical protein